MVLRKMKDFHAKLEGGIQQSLVRRPVTTLQTTNLHPTGSIDDLSILLPPYLASLAILQDAANALPTYFAP